MSTDVPLDPIEPVASTASTAPIDPLATAGQVEATSSLPLTHVGDHAASRGYAVIAEEVPVAVMFNGRVHRVVMATPADLEDLAYGYSVTESILRSPRGVHDLNLVRRDHRVEVQLTIPPSRADALDALDADLPAPHIEHTLQISEDVLWRAGDQLAGCRRLGNETPSIQAAAWALADGTIAFVREDIAIDNAFDKVCGALMRDGRMANAGFFVLTAAPSFSTIEKAASTAVELVVSTERPTGLAIRYADASGMTLVGLLNGRTANVYSHPERLTTPVEN